MCDMHTHSKSLCTAIQKFERRRLSFTLPHFALLKKEAMESHLTNKNNIKKHQNIKGIGVNTLFMFSFGI